MSSPVLSFPAADRQQWQDIVAKALNGASAESLNRTDEDGLDIAALYQVEPTAVTKSGQVPRTPVDSQSGPATGLWMARLPAG